MDEITLDRFSHEHYNMLINIERNMTPVMRTLPDPQLINDTREYYFQKTKKTIRLITDIGQNLGYKLKNEISAASISSKLQDLMEPLRNYLSSKEKFYPVFLSDKLFELEKFIQGLNNTEGYKYEIGEIGQKIKQTNLLLNEFFLRQAHELILFARKNAEEILTIHDNAKSPESEYRRLNIISIMEELIRNEYANSDGKKIDIQRRFEFGSMYVFGYRQDLSRALGNILNNAIKYNDQLQKYQVYILIKIYRVKTKVVIEIENWGPGIDPDELEDDLIYEKSYRGRQAVNRNIPGNGIGLYDAKISIEKCGGSIEIVSEKVRHNKQYITTVTVTLDGKE